MYYRNILSLKLLANYILDYSKYIMAAKNEGIINGISENKFGTGSNITREDMAVIVYNILKKNGIMIPFVIFPSIVVVYPVVNI